MLSEEEKKAIDNLFHLQHINMYLDLHTKETFKIKNKTIIKWKKSVEILINFITKLQKENEDIKSRKDNQEKRFKKYKENIDKQHEEIYENLVSEKEKYAYLYQKALDNTVKADKENIQLKKQIDLMAEEIRKTILIVKPESKFCQYEEDCKNIRCKDCIKQYFEKQAKEI